MINDVHWIAGTVQFRLDEKTAYSVEELLGMVLAHAKQQAEDFTDQKIKVRTWLNICRDQDLGNLGRNWSNFAIQKPWGKLQF